MIDFDLPPLLSDQLAVVVPERTYAGGEVSNPATTLFVWRTCRFPAEARGGVLAFYVDDYRFETLWCQSARYAKQFARFGWGAIIEPDFSLWRDAPLAEQLWSTYRMRTLGRLYQEHGLTIIPNLAWSDERSYEFCFLGIPRGCPVVACEARTAGNNDGDRRRFLAGLAEGIRQVRPAHVVVYGGQEHAFWLASLLPEGPRYTLLESWTRARGRIRRQQEHQQRHGNQFPLFSVTGGDRWVDADQAAAPAVAAHA